MVIYTILGSVYYTTAPPAHHINPVYYVSMVRIASTRIAVPLVLLAQHVSAMSPEAQQRASQLYQKQDWQGLEALAAPAAQRDPKDGWAWYYSGLANDGLGRRDAAAAAYQKALPYIPAYLQGSATQLLAQDYAALKQPDKLAALIRDTQTRDPQAARSLRMQFPSALPAPPPAALPEVSPRTLDAATAKVRRTWKTDAIPVQVNVDGQDNSPYRTVYDFYSPSSRTGLSVVQNGSNETALPAEHPQGWSTVAIPAQFLPLSEAVQRLPGPPHPSIQHAYLLLESGSTSAVGLSWSIALKASNWDALEVPAYILPKAEFDALNAAAGRGDAKAQYELALVYYRGTAGLPDRAKSAEWLAKSAAQGDAQAENKLGQYYQFGVGVQESPGLAAAWYTKAAKAGFAPGQYNLGLMYERGLGVPRNYVTARHWIDLAARQGLGGAIAELPIVTAAANGQIKRAEQLRQQQQRGANGCPLGYFKTPSGCQSIGAMEADRAYAGRH